MRAALRALGWVVSELIPAQALRVAMNRDYHRVAAERDIWRHKAEVLRDYLVELEAEEEVHEPVSALPETPADTTSGGDGSPPSPPLSNRFQ